MAYAAVQGRLVYFDGFTSTSTSQEIATSFAGNNGILFHIELQKGQRHCVADMSRTTEYPAEAEILISCNAGFRVLGADVDSFPHIVRLRLDDESNCPKRLTAHPCQQHFYL